MTFVIPGRNRNYRLCLLGLPDGAQLIDALTATTPYNREILAGYIPGVNRIDEGTNVFWNCTFEIIYLFSKFMDTFGILAEVFVLFE